MELIRAGIPPDGQLRLRATKAPLSQFFGESTEPTKGKQMQTAIGAISFAAQAVGASTTEIRAGWIISGLVAAFMAFDAAGKFAKPKQVTEAFEGIGWPIQLSSTLGAILLACAALYLIPQTSLFGAILLIGYLGGAVATNLRLHNPLSDAHAFSRVFRRAWLDWVVASGAQTPIGVPIVEVGVLG